MSFDKTPIKVIDGFDACDWGSDVVIEAEITSRDGTSAFIDEIAKHYPLTREADTVFSYDYHDGGSETMQIWCDREENTCLLGFAVCC